MTDKTPIKDIATERLTQVLRLCGMRKAEAEKDWAIVDHQRLPVLAAITDFYEEGISHTKAEAIARYDQDYQRFLTKRGEVRQKLIEARTKYDVIKFEIQLRINQSFERSREYNAGSLDT